MKWESRFGTHGFPGWHIECSAMALKHLGREIDIHTGGEDNVFPHHECEIAQSECHTGGTFSRLWMHARFLQVDGGKMAKSLGNVYSLDDVKQRGFEPRALRFALTRGHYRQPLNFTWEIMAEAAKALEGLDELAHKLRLAAGGRGAAPGARDGADALADARAKFEASMDDDLNVPSAIAALFELRNAAVQGRLGAQTAAEALAFLERANTVLAVVHTEDVSLAAGVQQRIDARNAARARRDFAESDRLRDELLAEGIVLEDTADGTVWRRGRPADRISLSPGLGCTRFKGRPSRAPSSRRGTSSPGRTISSRTWRGVQTSNINTVGVHPFVCRVRRSARRLTFINRAAPR
jgi:cysteinyl-tRNA synthetase